jgi:hypothetical protein
LQPTNPKVKKAKVDTMKAFGVSADMQSASPTESILNELLKDGPSLDSKVTKSLKPKGKK